jgi:hypothetical protein
MAFEKKTGAQLLIGKDVLTAIQWSSSSHSMDGRKPSKTNPLSEKKTGQKTELGQALIAPCHCAGGRSAAGVLPHAEADSGSFQRPLPQGWPGKRQID